MKQIAKLSGFKACGDWKTEKLKCYLLIHLQVKNFVVRKRNLNLTVIPRRWMLYV